MKMKQHLSDFTAEEIYDGQLIVTDERWYYIVPLRAWDKKNGGMQQSH